MKMPMDNLQSVIRCPVCDKKYRPAKILVLDEDDKRTTIHLTCESCGVASMVFVSSGQFGMVSLGLLTDLKQSEARAVFQSETVSTDNVIEAHQFLKHYTGGVEALLQ
jgi:transcription elongation factor Elf1